MCMIHSYDGYSPEIHSEAFVHPDATLIGQVVIKQGATIWPATVLRGDMGLIEIGANTSVQDGSVAHMTEGWSKCVIGDRVTVGHKALLHGCVVGNDCLIGMGAILMDNVEIGDGCLIAAGTLLPPNKKIPPNSFVRGAPGKIIREVGDRERAMIAGGWKTYVEHGEIYRKLNLASQRE